MAEVCEAAGADVQALALVRAQYPEVGCAPSAEAAVRDADLVLVLTEWPEFGEADPEVLGK